MAQLFGQQPGGVPRKGWPESLRKFFDYCDYRPGGVSQLGVIPALTGLTVMEAGFGHFRHTSLRFLNVTLPLTYSAGVVSYKGQLVYTFPQQLVKVWGVLADIDTTKDSAGLSATWAGLVSVGTTTADADAVLDTTEITYVPSTVAAAAVAGAGNIDCFNAADIAPLDGTVTPKPVFLNIKANTADTTATAVNVILNGRMDIHWCALGTK